MNASHFLAHAGVEHSSEAEALAHQSQTTTLIIIVTAVTLFVLAVAVRLLSGKQPKDKPSEKNKS